jgi:hypothetical protein
MKDFPTLKFIKSSKDGWKISIHAEMKKFYHGHEEVIVHFPCKAMYAAFKVKFSDDESGFM